MIRRLAGIVGTASLVVAAAGCTSHQANPSPSNLPVGSKVLIQRDGSGNATVDLTTLAAGQNSVSIHWVCVGKGNLNLVAAGKVVLGGGCADSSADATIDGGTVPIATAKSLSWQIQTAAPNKWRLIVTAG